jgi:uncharacterized membrane protein
MWIPIGLIALSVIPVIGGGLRISSLLGGHVTADNARFFEMPVPVLAHIFCVTVFAVLGALQFLPRKGTRHRLLGRLVVVCGLGTAVSGLWMTVFYPKPPGTGALLTGMRLVVGAVMFAELTIALFAVYRKDFRAHRAWMIRGYAIAMGAGTQALTLGIPAALLGPAGELPRALEHALGWLVNIVIAELVLRHRHVRVREARVGRVDVGLATPAVAPAVRVDQRVRP